MNNLNKSLVYLIGPIDNAEDYGIGWRNAITPVLRKYGVGVLNPCDKPTDLYYESENFIKEKQKLKAGGEFDRLSELMKPIVNYDYHMVDKSTFVICYIDNKVHMCGSYHETALSEVLKRPVLVICKQGKKGIPDWMYGMFDHNGFFDNFDDLDKHLTYINEHPKPEHLKRWKFLDYDRIFDR
jgi:hypothetical protein